MTRPRFVACLAYGVLAAAAATAPAAPFVDHFLSGATPASGEYAAAELNGQNPAVNPFSAGWTSTAGHATATASGINLAKITDEAGGAIVVSPPANTTTSPARATSATLTDDITGGGTGSAPIYASVLVRATAMADGGRAVFNIASTTNAIGISRVGTDFRVQHNSTGVTSNQWALNDALLLVVKISPNGATWGASNLDSFSQWWYDVSDDAVASPPVVEPTPMASSTGFHNAIASGGAIVTGISFTVRNATVTIDELKFGGSWAEVVAVPEPGSLALAGLAGLVPVLRRRK